MATGGPRARSGPLPDPNAIRTGATWVTLPARREGACPDWPVYAGAQSLDEALLWAELWMMPQAVMWEASNRHREVALFTRTYVRAAQEMKGDLLTAARNQMRELAMTDETFTKMRWRIATDEPATPEVKRPNGSRRASAKARFESLQGGRTA